MIGGPILGVFTLGLIYPWANSKVRASGVPAAQLRYPPGENELKTETVGRVVETAKLR